MFQAAFEAGCNYMDMALSLSQPHPEHPNSLPHIKLGDAQFADHDKWAAKGLLALLGVGVEPGLSNVFAKYAEQHLFSELDDVATRDGSNLEVVDADGNAVFAPSFSIVSFACTTAPALSLHPLQNLRAATR